jgi:predicted membrane protein
MNPLPTSATTFGSNSKTIIMKSTVIKYGLYGLVAGMLLFGGGLLFGEDLSYGAQEIIGYGSMVISLSFVFFGIRHYRDHVNGGHVTFGKALIIGLLISMIVGLGVGVADYLYTTVINPDFAAEYLQTTLDGYKASMSEAEYEAQKDVLTQQMQDYGGSGFMATLMFFTVVIIGFIISLISALILQKKN